MPDEHTDRQWQGDCGYKYRQTAPDVEMDNMAMPQDQ
jgi:hypothetical protein